MKENVGFVDSITSREFVVAENEDGIIVTVNDKSSSADLSTLRASIVNGKTYTVTPTYNANGIITAIKVE